jgi:ubiquinol-cytochrome c reductase cytochrome c1 subunit
MKKLMIFVFLAIAPGLSLAAGGHVPLDPVKIDLSDQASLQRGARIFVNFCLSCHSAAYMRYNRMGHDLGISEELVEENLLFAADKVGDLMKAVMPREDAKDWFDAVPPDLTVITRSKTPEYLYTYMRGFYRDPATKSGWNNIAFPGAAMPHVLYEWQGHQRAVFKTVMVEREVEQDGKKVKKQVEESHFDRFELERAGTMSAEDYDAAMRDLTNFMVYMGEPAKLHRGRIGVYVLLFLAVFFVVALLLKKEYWKDVH